MHTVDFSEAKLRTFLSARGSSLSIGQHELLIPIGPWVLNDRPEALHEMWLWRRNNASYFFFDQPPSLESYTEYLTKGPVLNKKRILFLVTKDTTPVGHLGLDVSGEERATIDNVLRGVGERGPGVGGLMERGLRAMISWANEIHGIQKFKLEVRSDNPRAIEFYKRCGFSISEVKRSGHHTDSSNIGLEDSQELMRIVMFRDI